MATCAWSTRRVATRAPHPASGTSISSSMEPWGQAVSSASRICSSSPPSASADRRSPSASSRSRRRFGRSSRSSSKGASVPPLLAAAAE
eukprot:10170219-Alexandrium_andersonii.AAC.1